MQAVLSMVTDKHSSDTRASASMTIKPLYEAYIHAHTCPELKHVSQPEVQSVLVGCMDKLLVAIHGELNQDARACAVEALRDLLLVTYETGVEDPYSNRSQFLCHVTCGPPGTLENSANLMEQIIQQLLLCCSEAFDRRNEKVKAYATALLESSGANDIEEGDYDELLEEIESEEDVITVATDGLGQLLKLCGKTAFMPYFDQGIGPAFLPFLLSPQQGCQLPGSDGSTTSTALQIIATCLVDDILEYGYNEGDTPACALLNSSQLQSVLATFMNALSSKNLLLQQSSSYGISQLLCNYPSLFTVKTIYTELLPSYMKLLSNPQAKDDEHIGITENCIYGIGIVLTKYRTCLDNIMGANAGTTVNTNSAKQMIAMVTHWLQYLPLQADEKESKCSLIHLCELLEKTDALILSNDVNALNSGAHHKFENMEVIFNIFAKSILIYNKSGAHVVSPPTPEDGCFPMHILTFQRMVHILKQYIGVNGMGGGMPSELVQFYISKLKPEYQQVLITVANESV